MIFVAIIAFIIILGLLIFVHELGHFIVAKRAGMRVEEFGFGFPPRALSIKRGGTIYSINWIPLGGFVRIAGEDGGDANDPGLFTSKSGAARLRVLLAGVVMNFLLGWLILFFGFWAIGTPAEVGQGMAYADKAIIKAQQTTIIAVLPNSPALTAGFQAGDAILSVDGQTFAKIDDLIAYATSHAGSPVTYQLKRGKQTLSASVVPRTNPSADEGAVGFVPAEIAIVKYPFFESASVATSSFVDKTGMIFTAFGQLLQKLVSSGKLVQGLSGPVGIAVLTKDFLGLGFAYLLQFVAILSINLGVVNAFPFPALDGGRVLFLAIEKIRGKRSMKWEQIANLVGFALLLLLMFAVTFRDVSHYSQQFKNLFNKIF